MTIRNFLTRPMVRCLMLAGVLALSHRHAASGADATYRVNNADQLVGVPATTAYARRVVILIKFTWSRAIERSSVPYGTVVVHLSVDRQGKMTNQHVVSGASDKSLRRLALHAITDTPLPTMPRDVVKELEGKRLGMDVTFDYIALPDAARKSTPR